MMTTDGTFIINGAERVVVSQLVRSPGVYFDRATDPTTGKLVSTAKLIPNRGAWLEFETSNRDVISVKVDRKRKMPVTILLRAIGMEPTTSCATAFADVDTNPDRHFIADDAREGADQEQRRGADRALPPAAAGRSADAGQRDDDAGEPVLQRPPLRPGARRPLQAERAPASREAAARSADPDSRILTEEDLIEIIREMIRLNNGIGEPDDIDHLGNRRIRAVGELIQMHVRTGFQRLERGIRERMTIQDPETVTPQGLISTTRPVMAAVREFFGGSQLSQFMDQTNPLAELTHKRRLSALGPGGLSRDRAGFDVRDVHPSHYGRICPIETPEGPNIGLIGSLATYGKINQYGFIETPYRRVISQLDRRRPGDSIRWARSCATTRSIRRAARSCWPAGTELTDAECQEAQEGRRQDDSRSSRSRRTSSTTSRPTAKSRSRSPRRTRRWTSTSRLIPDQVVVRVGGGHRFPVDSGRAGRTTWTSRRSRSSRWRRR